MDANKHIIDKLAWVHIKDRKLLVVRSKGKDMFFTVGGKREAGESDHEALIREVKEELGVSLLPATIVYVNSFEAQAHGKPEGIKVRLTCYTGSYTGELTPMSEIEEIGWFTSNDKKRATIPMQGLLTHLEERNLID